MPLNHSVKPTLSFMRLFSAQNGKAADVTSLRKIPTFKSDEQAARFVTTADLSEYEE
jgi:hypothetical protein